MPRFINKKELKSIKVALIKQDIYSDLYIAKPGDKDFFKKSPRRSGPLGLVETFDCDFFIVKTEPDDECNLWRQKITEAGHKDEAWWKDIPYSRSCNGLTNSDCAIDLNDIPFEEYDIIISFDISVPKRIVKQFPGQLWCYFISEPPLTAWKESWTKPLHGYDIFLTQMFGKEESFSINSKLQIQSHIINMPYVMASSTTYKKLFGFEKSKSQQSKSKPIAIMPPYAFADLDDNHRAVLGDLFDLKSASGNIDRYLGNLFDADYYLRPGTRAKFGNETIEAVASGCLFVSSTHGWKNRIFDVPLTRLKDKDTNNQIKVLKSLVDQFHKNKDLFVSAKQLQKKRLDRICYWNPILILLDKLEEKKLRQFI